MADKTLVTFRYDREKWEAIKEMANAEGTNASAIFSEFADWYLAGNRVSGDAQPATQTHLDKSTEQRLDNIEQCLDKRDEHLEKRIDSLDKCIYERDEHLEKRIDSLDKCLDKRDEHLEKRIDSLDKCIYEMKAQLEELREKLTAR